MASGQDAFLAGRLKLDGRELADRLEHGPAFRQLRMRDDQRGASKVAEHWRDVVICIGQSAAHRDDRLRGPAPCECREPSEQAALVASEQVEAPLQRGAERLVARRCCPPSVGQQREPVGKPGEHAAERSVTQGRRGQLDCQWYPVQLGHDAGDIGGVVIGELELRVDRAGSVHEQAHRLGGGGLGCPFDPVRFHYRQWAQAPHHLALDVERLPARGQDHQVRAVPGEALGEVRHGVEQVLAVVQHQESHLVGHCLDEDVVHAPPWHLCDTGGLGNSPGYRRGIRQRRQLD